MNHTFRMIGIVALVLLFAGAAGAQVGTVKLQSPGGALEIAIGTLAATPAVEGQLAYSVSFRGKPVVEWSNLGLVLDGAPPMGKAVRIESSQASSEDASWTAVQGKANPIRNRYNAVTVRAMEPGPTGRSLHIEARAYDDGVAFRYVVPEQANLKSLRVLNEATEFRFPKDARTFSLISRGFQTSNEDAYHELPLSGLHPEYLVNLPLLLELPGTAWVGLTEAHLEAYPNLFVTGTGGRALAARLAVRVEDVNTSADTAPSFDPKADATMVSAVGPAPMRSGWRVFMVGDKPGRLVESNMVRNLNPPSAIADTSWITPGKTPWDWWNGSQAKGVATPGKNNETMKYYIDFSARNKFEFMLIDAGWALRLPATPGGRRGAVDLTRSTPAIDIPMLVEYAKSKGVRLWLWAHFRDMNEQMDAAYAQFEKWGIAGVKIDFLDRSDQWMVDWYRTAARKAAEHRLMLNYHGAFKPDGMERTFPNVMTREGVMGAEYNKWSAATTPPHDVTLAFTRMLAGPMDYTPGGFDNVTREAFFSRNRAPMVMGTRAHHTALFVVFESELQMVSDSPDAYTGQKELAFLKAVPSSWDETRVLNGMPPKFVTVARRRGAEWFVGSITDWDAREISVPLDFLGAGNSEAEIYADGPNAATEPKDSTLRKQRVNAKTVLKLKLAPGGGCAIHLVPRR